MLNEVPSVRAGSQVVGRAFSDSGLCSMEFLPYFAKLPEDRRYTSDVAAAATRLQAMLSELETGCLDISDYIKRSLASYVGRLPHTLRRDAFVFLWAVAGARVPLEDIVFVDYGGGTGTLSLLAKEAGVGTVIYSDIYDVSCRDARAVACALGREADHYVIGDIERLVDYMSEMDISCDVLASINVIEHIYDIEHFLSNLGSLSRGAMKVALFSVANPFNPARKLQMTRKQRRAETAGSQPGYGHKERDTTEAFLSVRLRIIRDFLDGQASQFPFEEVEQLARGTRGMAENDIRSVVARYLATRELPPGPAHPTNTCDPYTGNWVERLMDLDLLARRLGEAGFSSQVLCGYYSSAHPAVRLLARPLNVVIRFLGDRWGLAVAPSYVVHGRK